MGDLAWVTARGSPYQIGLALGLAGRRAVQRHLLREPLWAEATDPRHALLVGRIAAQVQARFPAIWAEIKGLAEGLDLPVTDVMAWQCRGDILAMVPEGCTTVLIPGATPQIAHNEDGFPFLRGSCFIAEVTPEDAPAFVAFCYPGSIPGHTFAVTRAGLVATVNNIRLAGVVPGMSRMVLGRAALGAQTLAQVQAVLRDAGSGGFHIGMMRAGERRVLSAEFGAGALSLAEVTVPAIHANHALHHPGGPKGQVRTDSSLARQARGEALLAAGAGRWRFAMIP